MDTENPSIDQVLVSIRQIIRAIDLHSRKLIQQYGITIPQIIVLKEVAKKELPTVGNITKAVSLSQGTVTQILIRLEQRGYILRSRDDSDKRKVLVTSTDEGRKVLENAPSLLHEQFISSFENLKDWEQSLMVSSLQHVAEMMDAEKLEAAPIISPGITLISDPIPALPENSEFELVSKTKRKRKC